MLKKVLFLVSLLILVVYLNTQAQNQNDDILGIWLPESKKGHVEIEKRGDKYFGKLIWLKNPTYEDGSPKVDKNNPDPKKQKTPLKGLYILRDFIFDGDDEWEDGKIYDPETGDDYSCYITMINKDKMKVRGYIGISLIGKTQIWTRVQ